MPIIAAREWARRWWPEAALAVLAGIVFLGFLGAIDLWGKREQRASAEAIDTIDQNHWLVAQIQGRPRLEKPPLPRWTIATLMRLTGRRDEWMVRLPSALAALGMVGLVYGLGCRLGGRSVGVASGLALCSIVFFITELRQAGNDGPLAFFTTLALYAAWRRIRPPEHEDQDEDSPAAEPALEPVQKPAGARGWSFLFYIALGFGFLSKGPIIVILVALALVPFLVLSGQLRTGLRRLADGWGLLLFLVLALSWPIPVLLTDPNAARVWYLEMGQKAGTAGISHHRHHEILAAEWVWMTAPWVVLASLAVLRPFLPRGWAQADRRRLWFPWCWAVLNLLMFCFWAVAKPNYYLPCLPAVALLIGSEWVRLTRTARHAAAPMVLARALLQLHWVILFVAALATPVVTYQVWPEHLVWAATGSAAIAVGVLWSAWAWRRGADAGALIPLVTAWSAGILILYGAVGPHYNARRSHRALAATLEQIVPPNMAQIMFFRQIDEGLWFYLRDHTLAPVPGSQPRYNAGADLDDDFKNNRLEWDPNKRAENVKKILVEWLTRPDRPSSYVLLRTKEYDLFAHDLAGLTTLVHREHGLYRNELVLLHVAPGGAVAAQAAHPAGERSRQ
jgi:4-amino-4-deoxy-L-arabinose transferase-like glycosyltransferase